jgi:macrocin-O-methyltransferase TylF-like protien
VDVRRFADRGASILRPRIERVARRFGWMSVYERVHWLGARSPRQAAQALASRASGLVIGPGQWALIVGADGPLRLALERELQDRGVAHRTAERIDQIERGRSSPACILLADTDVSRVTDAARAALADPLLSSVPLEYSTGLEPEAKQFRDQDEYARGGFISPVLLADPSPYRLYSSSLERFEQKCGLRDYLDLYQLLVSVHEREIPGDVAEFGSYKGHSGWLIASTLKALGSDRAVHLFDMFDAFPQEAAGVDYFWSGTHHVQLEEVRDKLAGLDAIQLHAGEFERTLPASSIDRLALAYVDCDSYRAVSYLANALFEQHLAPGGIMVFEDYGHPALLGCRVAVDEFFDGRTDCIKFFSQFSGLYVAVKL